MNKLSTEIDSFGMLLGHKKALEMAKKAGFSFYNFDLYYMAEYDFQNDKLKITNHPLASENFRDYLLDLKKFADSIGMKCNQTHAPFPIHIKDIYNANFKAIEATNILGADIMVIHPDTFKSLDENAKIIKKLAIEAQKFNIKIAVENVFNWSGTHAIFAVGSTAKSLLDLILKINEPNVGACLDIGHAEIMGEIACSIDFINTLKDKLIATHIHDNNKKNDQHKIPFSGSINFEEICKVLKKNKYDGFLTLESIYYYGLNKEKGQENVNDLYKSILKIDKMINCS